MQGCTPLFYGIRAVNNSENISAAFLSHSSASELDLYHADKAGDTALHVASQLGRAGVAAAVFIKMNLAGKKDKL